MKYELKRPVHLVRLETLEPFRLFEHDAAEWLLLNEQLSGALAAYNGATLATDNFMYALRLHDEEVLSIHKRSKVIDLGAPRIINAGVAYS